MARGATSSTTPPSGRRARVRRPRRAGGDACDSRRRGGALSRAATHLTENCGLGVPRCMAPEAHRVPIVVAHREAARVRDSREPVHPAVVDLLLLLVEAVDEITRLRTEGQVNLEGAVGDVLGEAKIRRRFVTVTHIHDGWEELVRQAMGIALRRGRAGGGDPVGAGEEAEEIVEAPVLQVDDDDVVDLLERGRRVGAGGLMAEPWAPVYNQRQRGQSHEEKAVVSEPRERPGPRRDETLASRHRPPCSRGGLITITSARYAAG